ncbi:hypothetical protein B0H16DRAFT_1534149 [Mycena metata]|uniref:Uncharacterized protein n=1 Tax=Mycena metata TaxID=1033252 RepID=A0AAD7J9H7_9AGAR|nr:hypothetical protein B0H16DRAFT_1534149 [Mycena metata]
MRGGEGRPALQRERRVRQLLVAVALTFTFALHLQLVTLSIAQLPLPIAIPLSFSFALGATGGPGCLGAFMGALYIDDGSDYELLLEAARVGQMAARTGTHFLLLAIPWIHIPVGRAASCFVCGWLLLLLKMWLLGG